MPQEWHDRSYWSVMLQTVPEAAELFCNVRLCFVTLSSPAERFPAANGRLGLQRSIWPDPSYRKVGSTAKKWQDVATLPSHTSRSTLTPFHWKWINVSAVLRKKIPKFFFFFPDAIDMAIANVLPDVFIFMWRVIGLLRTVNTAKKIHTSPGERKNSKANTKPEKEFQKCICFP